MSVGLTVSLVQIVTVGFAHIHTLAVKLILTLNRSCSTDCYAVVTFLLHFILEAVGYTLKNI